MQRAQAVRCVMLLLISNVINNFTSSTPVHCSACLKSPTVAVTEHIMVLHRFQDDDINNINLPDGYTARLMACETKPQRDVTAHDI